MRVCRSWNGPRTVELRRQEKSSTISLPVDHSFNSCISNVIKLCNGNAPSIRSRLLYSSHNQTHFCSRKHSPSPYRMICSWPCFISSVVVVVVGCPVDHKNKRFSVGQQHIQITTKYKEYVHLEILSLLHLFLGVTTICSRFIIVGQWVLFLYIVVPTLQKVQPLSTTTDTHGVNANLNTKMFLSTSYHIIKSHQWQLGRDLS